MKKLFVVALALILFPALTLAQDTGKKKAYFFYGETCPHCKKVEAYFQENGIYDKYEITSLEFSNPFNAKLLLKFGDVFKDPNKGGVPAVAFGDKFIVGDQPIIDKFVNEIDAADNAYTLPNPDTISPPTANVGQDSSNAPAAAQSMPAVSPTGNKKNYFPVIITVLIILGVGALIYVNRKK